MRLFAKLNSIKGNHVDLELEDELPIHKLEKYSDGKQPTIEINVADGRIISPDQRKKIYALLRDISNWSGYTVEKEIPQVMKWQYLINTGADMFSLSDCSMTQANEYLNFILDFCFYHNVPFKTKTWDMLPNDYLMQYRCLKHRKCCICGEKAEIAHEKTVGMGRNRKTINHSNFYFMALCPKHHRQQHNVGLDTFLQHYHIKPVKLKPEDIKKLKIGG